MTRGINFTGWWRDAYVQPKSDAALATIAEDGHTAVAILTTWYMDGFTSSHIAADPNDTPSDASVLHAMRVAHENGLSVVLKPHIDLRNNGWRGRITPADVDAWWADYDAMILHYADLAAQGGASMLEIGTELGTMSGDTERWRELIAAVRARFSGKLTYAANYDEYTHVAFWDALDYIGVDAYFPLTSSGSTDVAQIAESWRSHGYLDQLASTSAAFDRPILFTEIGYRSATDTAVAPAIGGTPAEPSQAAQAAAYAAVYEAFADEPWFAGMYWWNWDATDVPPDPTNTDYPPFGKAAESVMREWNARLESREVPPPAAEPPVASPAPGPVVNRVLPEGPRQLGNGVSEATAGAVTPSAASVDATPAGAGEVLTSGRRSELAKTPGVSLPVFELPVPQSAAPSVPKAVARAVAKMAHEIRAAHGLPRSSGRYTVRVRFPVPMAGVMRCRVYLGGGANKANSRRAGRRRVGGPRHLVARASRRYRRPGQAKLAVRLRLPRTLGGHRRIAAFVPRDVPSTRWAPSDTGEASPVAPLLRRESARRSHRRCGG